MEIKHIVNQIDNGNISIPEFQRGYVWNRQKTTLLMNSLYHQYPIGVVTYWEQPDDQNRSIRMIVDGQQRLTTIYACFRDKAPPHHRKGRGELPTGMCFSPKREQFKFPTSRDRQEDHTWIKVSDLLQESEAGISEWEERVEADGASRDELRRYRQHINKLIRVRDREVKEQEIESTLDPEEVIQIFDRINAQGQKLTRGELEIAWISIRCDEARELINREVEKWSKTPMRKVITEDSIIRNMAAIHTGKYQTGIGQSETFKASNPTANDIVEVLEKVSQAHESIGTLLLNRLAVSDHRAISTSAPFTIISKFVAAQGGKFPDAKTEAQALAYHLGATGWGIYHGSTASAIDADLKELDTETPWQNLYKSTCSKLGVSDIVTDPAKFKIARRSSNRFFCIVEMLQKTKDMKDWYTGIPIREYPADELDAHHIFPRIHLDARGTPYEDLENIANIALITKETNQKIRDRAPEAYLDEIDRQDQEMLRAHCIPRDKELWKIENYEKFLEKRRELMSQKTNLILGRLRQGILP